LTFKYVRALQKALFTSTDKMKRFGLNDTITTEVVQTVLYKDKKVKELFGSMPASVRFQLLGQMAQLLNEYQIKIRNVKKKFAGRGRSISQLSYIYEQTLSFRLYQKFPIEDLSCNL
jgi:hypothetical protein